jgi:hypothetical protein
MGTYPILAYVHLERKSIFKINDRKQNRKIIIALSLSVYMRNCNVFYSLQDNKLRLMIISLKLKVIMEWT